MNPSWQFIALSRRTIYRLAFDHLEVILRELARVDEGKREQAVAVLNALTVCRREVENDPCIGPLPQSEVCLGQALAELGSVGPAPRIDPHVSETIRYAIMMLASIMYDLGEIYPRSAARKALLKAAHVLERDDTSNARSINLNSRLRALSEAAYKLAPFGFGGVRRGLRIERDQHGRRAR